MAETTKTHYRRAFDSPYLSSADIVEPTVVTIKCVKLEIDKTKKTKDYFNTAYFIEKEIRQGEELKPMILNATNSRTVRKLADSVFIEYWNNIPVTIYVDDKVRFGSSTVEGLRISSERPRMQKPAFSESHTAWEHAVAAYIRDGNFDKIESRVVLTEAQKGKIKEMASTPTCE